MIDLDGVNILRAEMDLEGVPTLQFMSPAQAGDNPWPAESFTLHGLEGTVALYNALGELLAAAAKLQGIPQPTSKIPL
ncbi:MAG: hypothetical protein AB7U98_13695 [Candidatus Nitrosocosmicus sp.]